MPSLQVTTALMGIGLAFVITRIERDVRRLNQRLALLEADLDLPAHPRPDQDSL